MTSLQAHYIDAEQDFKAWLAGVIETGRAKIKAAHQCGEFDAKDANDLFDCAVSSLDEITGLMARAAEAHRTTRQHETRQKEAA